MIFGDGISGLTSSYTLGQKANSDLPNANLALVVSVGVYVGAPVVAWWTTPNGRLDFLRWFLLTASVGFVAFAISRLFA